MELPVRGSRVLLMAFSICDGVWGKFPSSIRGVTLTPIWETVTEITILLLSIPAASSLSSSTSKSESNLSSRRCAPVDENEWGNERESSPPPLSEALLDV